LLRSDGSRVPVEISSVALIGNGQVVGVFGTAHEKAAPRHSAVSMTSPLTPRQTEILALLAHGCSTGQVAQQLGLAIETVRNHIRAILRRLGVHSRLEAVLIAQREGLI
jgi:DNA-binding NarL/FixJ family response regulator